MPKNILIYSDGTGQIGGQKPDQRLSNVYKMYRASRPGPDSPIKPNDQVAFYDAGPGAGETDGLTFRRIRSALEAAFGTGIDDNVIDCYEAIIANYEPGDKISILGFSRGAYTARSVANVMNLCGVPTTMPDGSAVPRHGPKLRKIASDAVKYVYNHGAGHKRSQYEDEREKKACRFREKYGSNAKGEKAFEQGNVQPTFIGVFDTVAALGNKLVNWFVYSSFVLLAAGLAASFLLKWPLFITYFLLIFAVIVGYWLMVVLKSQFKYYSPDSENKLSFKDPRHWYSIWKQGHHAVWSRQYYDTFLDSDVQFARHALAIDETRKEFPRVVWGSLEEEQKTQGRKPEWMKQVWFAGCHSDIGGSYPEPESRLSDISLQWMIDELKECVPDIIMRDEILVTSPDPKGLQHSEIYLIDKGPLKLRWGFEQRTVNSFSLHPTVLERMKAGPVPQMGEVKAYRPETLAQHLQIKEFYK